MYAVVVYNDTITKILKVCSLIDANNYLDTLIENKQEDYFRENYIWYCKFNNTIRTIAQNDAQIYAIVEIKTID